MLENADAASTLAQAHWGVNLFRLMWMSGRLRFAPELQAANPMPVELWSGPTPREILARSAAVQGGLAEQLIEPCLKAQPEPGPHPPPDKNSRDNFNESPWER